MKSMPIKLRLTLWYCLIFGIIMGIVIAAIYYVHRQSQFNDVDRLLDNVTTHVHEEIGKQLNEGKQLEEVQLSVGDLSVNGIALWVKNNKGELIETNSHAFLGDHSFLNEEPATNSNAFKTITDDKGERIRILTVPIHKNGTKVGYIQTFYSLKDLDQALQQFKWMVTGLSVIGIALALIAGWFLAKKTLERVDLIRKTAKAIAVSKDFKQRVLYIGPPDELGKLTETFNHMLETVEKSDANQKRFLSDASHELRAPLTTIQGNLDILTKMKNIPEVEREEILQDIRSEAIRMSKLVSDLLSLARADAGQIIPMEVINLAAVTSEVVTELKVWDKEVEVTTDIAKDVRIWGNERLIKQLIIILLDNAFRYTPADGLVSVTIAKENEQAEVRIKDTGIGIEKEELPFVFERFYRTEAARRHDPEGTGLGLSIAKWVIDKHEGSIVLTSNPGSGTEFILCFPLIK